MQFQPSLRENNWKHRLGGHGGFSQIFFIYKIRFIYLTCCTDFIERAQTVVSFRASAMNLGFVKHSKTGFLSLRFIAAL